jgi:hypothetical protein
MERTGKVKMVWYGNLTGIIVKDGVNPPPPSHIVAPAQQQFILHHHFWNV